MCLLTVTLSWNSFSQTVTEIKDTCHVVLSTDVARKVAVDLLEGDAAKEQLHIVEEKAAVLDSTVTVQQQQIWLQEEQFIAQGKLLELYKVQAAQNIQDVERLNKEIRVQRTWSTVFATTTGVSVIALVCALIFGGK